MNVRTKSNVSVAYFIGLFYRTSCQELPVKYKVVTPQPQHSHFRHIFMVKYEKVQRAVLGCLSVE
jgi:hypothetical protein